MASVDVLADIAIERDAQVAKGYDFAHDVEHGTDRLVAMAGERARNDGEPRELRRARLIQCAALIVAAVEVLDES